MCYNDVCVCVMCSAGVGRTGTLITVDRVLDQIAKERVVDIAGVVQHLRGQRMKMVQNPVSALELLDWGLAETNTQ